MLWSEISQRPIASSCSNLGLSSLVRLYTILPSGHGEADGLVFVTTDVLCIFVQLAGGALFGVSAGGDSDSGVSVDTATNILMAGLILQVSHASFPSSRSRCAFGTDWSTADRIMGDFHRLFAGSGVQSVPI